jgi:hypothetical protein
MLLGTQRNYATIACAPSGAKGSSYDLFCRQELDWREGHGAKAQTSRSRREPFRRVLAHGIDPSALKAALGKYTFEVTLREWERARGATSALSLRGRK